VIAFYYNKFTNPDSIMVDWSNSCSNRFSYSQLLALCDCG